MKWLKYGLLSLAVALVTLVVVGFFLPSAYRIERSVVIDADPEAIHEYVGDLDKWTAWEPWSEEDPTIRVERSDNTTGVGAHQSWSGESGGGELTLTRNSVDEGIAYDLTFDDEHESQVTMRYQADGAATRVVWTMEGDSGMNLIGRYFGLVMDSMVGPMFERGLEKLKFVVEQKS